MEYTKALIRLHELVRQIYDYYVLNSYMINDQFVVNRAMVRYIFPEMDETELGGFLAMLHKDGCLIRSDRSALVFSATFYMQSFIGVSNESVLTETRPLNIVRLQEGSVYAGIVYN